MRIRWFTAIILILTLYVGVIGQEDPQPTKTPEPEEISENSVDEGDSTFMEPFTQSDLNVLIGNVQRPNGFGWFGDNIYAVCNGDWTLYEINGTTGSTRTYIFGVRNAHDMHIEGTSGADIDIWIPDFDLNALLRVDRTRAPVEIVGGLEGPWGIAYYDDNQFLVTNLSGNSISMISREGEVTNVVGELRSPTGIVYEDGSVYFANNASARRSIEWFEMDEDTGEVEIQPLVSGLQNTTNLVMGPDEKLYFTYALGTRGVVGRVDPQECLDEGCSNDQVEIVLYTELAAPLAGLTISPDMRLFVHTIFRPEIYWVQLDTEGISEQVE